jgi:hypothetical protein
MVTTMSMIVQLKVTFSELLLPWYRTQKEVEYLLRIKERIMKSCILLIRTGKYGDITFLDSSH